MPSELPNEIIEAFLILQIYIYISNESIPPNLSYNISRKSSTLKIKMPGASEKLKKQPVCTEEFDKLRCTC